MEPGHVVEYIDSQKIFCAVVTDIKKLRLRLLTENNREVKLAVSRLTHRSDLILDTTATRLKLIGELKEIAARVTRAVARGDTGIRELARNLPAVEL